MDQEQHGIEGLLSYPFAKLIPIVAAGLITVLILHALIAYSAPRRRKHVGSKGSIAKIVYCLFVALTIGLSVTSFGSILAYGKMEKQALLLHIMAAGAFTAVMVAFALCWNPVIGRMNMISSRDEDHSINGWWLARWSLWLVLLSSLGVAGSMLLGMLPLFDTQQMELSISLHRYFGLLLVISLSVHLYSIAVQVLRWR